MKYIAIFLVVFLAASASAQDVPLMGPKTKAAILHIAADVKSPDRLRALNALAEAEIKGADVQKLYQAALQDKNPVVRAVALWGIGRAGIAGLKTDVIKALKDVAPQVRREACNAVYMLKLNGVALPLTDSDMAVRIAAARAAPVCGGSADALQKAYLAEKSARVKPHILRAIAAIDNSVLFNVLPQALQDPSPMVCGAALELIAQSKEQNFPKSFLRLANSKVHGSDVVLKSLAVVALVKLNPQYRPWKNSALVSSDNVVLRRAVAKAAGLAQNGAIADFLVKMANDKDFSTRRQASVSLIGLIRRGVVEKSSIVPMLKKMLGKDTRAGVEALFVAGSVQLADVLSGTEQLAQMYKNKKTPLSCVWFWAAGESGFMPAGEAALKVFADATAPDDCLYQAVEACGKLQYRQAVPSLLKALLKKNKDQDAMVWRYDGTLRDKMVDVVLQFADGKLISELLNVAMSDEPAEEVDNIKKILAAAVKIKFSNKQDLKLLEFAAKSSKIHKDLRWLYADAVFSLTGKDLRKGLKPPVGMYSDFFVDAD